MSLRALIEVVREPSIGIYLSDNSSDDETRVVVAALASEYPYLHYSRCPEYLEADENFERALKLSTTKYRWLFGDHYKIVDEKALKQVLELLEEDFDLIVLNSNKRIRNLVSGVYTDKDATLSTLGWHMTMMTALVYNSEFLAKLNFPRFKGTFLSQTLTIFERLAESRFSLYWVQDVVIGSFHFDPSTSWHPRALQIFVRDWFHGVMSLPPTYTFESKKLAIMSHASNVSLFSLKGMIYLRGLGAINLKSVKAYIKELPYVFRADRLLYLLLSLLVPVFIARFVQTIYFKLNPEKAGHLPKAS